MSSRHLLLIPLVLAISAAPAPAQDTGQDSLTAQLRRLENDWMAAVQRHDGAAVGALLSDRYRLTTVGGRVLTKAQLLEAIAADSTRYLSMDMPEFEVRQVGGAAIVWVLETATTLDGGREVAHRVRVTEVWLRQPDGRWLCATGAVTPMSAE